MTLLPLVAFWHLSPGGTLSLVFAAAFVAFVLARLSVMLATVDARARARRRRMRR